jgi:flagellar motility protein MotE (MotC chaperone)
MAIDRHLLKRILEHYKHRLDVFLQDEKIKPLASGHLARHIDDLKREVDTSLTALTSLKTDLDTETKNWIHVHTKILKPAVTQYQKDVKQLLEEAGDKLSGPNLHELEIELARIAAEIATLLNL